MPKFDPSKSRRHRPVGETRELRKTFLIYCEGQTETEYFRNLKSICRLSNIDIIPIELTENGNALTLAREAVKRKTESTKEFDEYWIVFDKDDTKDHEFQEAIKLCEGSGIQTAYSIQAFELWLLLHFNFICEKMDRSLYEEKLNQCLKTTKYGKTKETLQKVFEELKDKMPEAIRNARKGSEDFESRNIPIPLRESSSTIYKLIERLSPKL